MNSTEKHPQWDFHVHQLNADDSPGTFVGGAYDDTTAVAIMCACYAVAQNYAASTARAFGVFNEQEECVAVIGSSELSETPEEEA
jgi:hypothetical protein